MLNFYQLQIYFQRLVFHCGHGGVHVLRLVAHLAWPGHRNAFEPAEIKYWDVKHIFVKHELATQRLVKVRKALMG